VDDERKFSAINIAPIGEGGDRFRFRLLPDAHDSRAAITFEITAAGLAVLLNALQGLQVKYRIPIPPTVRPARGRPDLRIVTDDP